MPDRAVDVRQRILHRHRLRPARLHVLVGAPEAGQQIGHLPRRQMRAVQLGRDVDGQPQPGPGRLHPVAVGQRADQLPPSMITALTRPSRMRLAGLHGVQPVFLAAARCRTARAACRPACATDFSPMPTVRWPCTLECPRTGEMPAPSRPMLPRISSRLHEHPEAQPAVHVLRQPHAVDADDVLRPEIDLGRLLDHRAAQARCRSISAQLTARTASAIASKPAGLAGDEAAVEHRPRRGILGREHAFASARRAPRCRRPAAPGSICRRSASPCPPSSASGSADRRTRSARARAAG